MLHAIVIGLGKSGIAAARLLRHQGWQVTVSDRGKSEALQRVQQTLEQEGIAVQLGHPPTLNAETAHTTSRIVVSPGVPWDSPTLVQARALGIEVMGEMELAWQTLSNIRSDIPWIAVTGTNGKTTVTSLLAAIFKAANCWAPACGNIGHAACDVALEALTAKRSPQWIIAEVSSYQIEASPSLAPDIGLWTTFTPDHLSRHKTLDRYYGIKAQLLQRAKQAIFNADDKSLRQRAADWPEAHWTCQNPQLSSSGEGPILPKIGLSKVELSQAELPGQSSQVEPSQVESSQAESSQSEPPKIKPPQIEITPIAYLKDGWVWVQDAKIVSADALPMRGDHNQQNLLMAVAAARLAGLTPEAIARGVETFPGVPHRLEQIVRWQGIDFINDSKATNYDAAEVGLRSVSGPVILIAGGDPKAGDDQAWLDQIQAKAAFVLLIGGAAAAFAERLHQVGYTTYKSVATLDVAVPLAATLAQKHEAKAVLLSPACASFDQYRSFEHRGDHFRQLCQLLR